MGLVLAVVVVVAILAVWEQATSLLHVFERTRTFAEIMQVVRPVVLLLILIIWRPAFARALDRGWVSRRTHERAQLIWPRATIWVLLVEVTLGQGYVLAGLLSAAAYWFFYRIGRKEASDGR